MQLWISHCGNAFRLDADWQFTLHAESRNDGMRKAPYGPRSVEDSKRYEYPAGRNGNRYSSGNLRQTDVILPSGTELVADRVYIHHHEAKTLGLGKNVVELTVITDSDCNIINVETP